jgi:hypothetical protein
VTGVRQARLILQTGERGGDDRTTEAFKDVEREASDECASTPAQKAL